MQLIIAIIIAAILYSVQQKVYRKIWNKNLSIHIRFDDTCVACKNASGITEEIVNDKFLPLPVLHVKFATDRSFSFTDSENAVVTDSYHRNDVFSVMGHQKITRKLAFDTSRRGMFSVTGIDVIARDFFMTRSFAAHIPNHTELYVFPEKYTCERFSSLCNKMLGDVEIRRALTEDPYVFEGIRDYDRTCSMRSINWHATARTGNLMVNKYGHSAEHRIKILLNMEPNVMFKVEYLQEIGIRLASSAADYFLQEHFPVMLESNGTDMITGEPEIVESGSAPNHMISIDKNLARIAGNYGLDHFMHIIEREIVEGANDISYVIISSYCKEDLLIKLDYLKRSGACVSMIVPHYDIQVPDTGRSYIYGWEVKLDEA
ncbi:MAG: DUF58 domain-containing protein [Wujia sp.]